MEQFDLNDFYRGVSNFWNSIAPIILTHVVVLIVLKWTVGTDWHILERTEYYINTEQYKRWRKILDEFDLRSKAFFIIIVAVFFYFALFNNVVQILNGFYPITIIYSEWDLMEEGRNLSMLVDISSYGSETDIEVYDVFVLKERFLDEFEAKYPDRFRSSLNWAHERFSEWSSYYVLSIIFFLITIILLVNRIRRRKTWKTPYSRFAFLFIFSLLMVVFTRYQAEQVIEERLLIEESLVINELRFDTSKQPLNDEQIAQIRYNLYLELKNPKSPHFFWLSRYIDYIPFVERKNRRVSDEQFQQWHGDVSPP